MDAPAEPGKCPYSGGERESQPTDVERKPVGRDARNLV
jgi:hypothetical protein